MRVTAYIYFPINNPRHADIEPALDRTAVALKELQQKVGAINSIIADAVLFNNESGDDEVIF
jgi:hypothetical protein